MHFGLCICPEQDLASFHPTNGPIIFAPHPPVTQKKQHLSMSNSLDCVVPILPLRLFQLHTAIIIHINTHPRPTASHQPRLF